MTAATYVEWLKSAALSNDAVRKEDMKEESGNRGYTNPAAEQLVNLCLKSGVKNAVEMQNITGVDSHIFQRQINHQRNTGDMADGQRGYTRTQERKRQQRMEDNIERMARVVDDMSPQGEWVTTIVLAERAGITRCTVRRYSALLADRGRIKLGSNRKGHMQVARVLK